MTHALSPVLLAQLSDVIAAQMGLHFPRARWHDLERGIRAAARELDFPDVAACTQALVSSPLSQHQIAILAGHLTIGETYFFREPLVFAMLEEKILPALMHTRRERTRRLRIWSAGCATGEEPYSIAISIKRAIPDRRDWEITLLATDINPRFQQTAAEGVYRDWSFRDTPPWIKAQYFCRQPGGRWAILATIQKMVTFARLNLVDDVYPSPLTNTMAMDVIFCRNVLMYLAPEQAKKVVYKLYQALAHGGWLIVSPSETSQTLFSSFRPVNIPGAILYRKGASGELPVASGALPVASQSAVECQIPRQGSPHETQCSKPEEPTLYREALALYQQGHYTAVEEILAKVGMHDHSNTQALALLARVCANQGRLTEARQWCERALATDRLNAGMHYLRATILQEQGAVDEAVLALRRALYLDQNFVPAHMAMGTLALRQGRFKEAGKRFETILALLSAHRPDEILPESEGMTVGRLGEIIALLYRTHATP
jgi:chemotaxis protein methyltransferase CheR